MYVALSFQLGIFSANTSPTLVLPLMFATPEMVTAGCGPVSDPAMCFSLR